MGNPSAVATRAAKIIDGVHMAGELRSRVADEAHDIHRAHGFIPGLAVVLVGADPASQVYVRKKGEQAVQAGLSSFVHRLDAQTSQEELLDLIDRLNADESVHGILVQLPLPPDIDETAVLHRIDPAKDVDGFHPSNVGALSSGGESLVPCTPQACLMLLERSLGSLSGLRAVVLGRSNIVGKPVAQLLLRQHCTVTIAHSRTRDLAEECRRADILIAAVGKPLMVQGDWIKPGATVIDVGINRIERPDGKARLVGDVDFDSAVNVAGAITPVPGGVGPMTIACLLRNTLLAARRQHGI